MPTPDQNTPPHTRSPRTWSQWLLPAGTVLAGVCLSVGLFAATRGLETERLQADFDRAVSDRALAVQEQISTQLLVLRCLTSLYESSAAVERGELRSFVTPILGGPGQIQALGWAPRVARADRAAWEAGASAEGMGQVRITQRDAAGNMVPAGDRPEYFPVHYVEPWRGNEMALGFDLGSQAARLEAITSARRTGRATATASIRLLQDSQGHSSIIIVSPFFRPGPGPQGPADSPESLKGFVLGVYRVGRLVEQALSDLRPAGIDIALTDSDADSAERLLYRHASRTQSRSAPRPHSWGVALRQSVSFPVAQRTWTAEFTPTAAFIDSHLTWTPWAFMALGLVLTALLAAYFVAASRGRARLLEANHQLSQAIHRAEGLAVAARAASQAKSEFLSNMSHEIRTPLTAILGYVELLGEPAHDPAQHEQYLAIVRQNGEHLLELIRDILDVAKIEAGKLVLDPRPCSVHAVIAQVASTMRPRALERGIVLSVEYPGPLPATILADDIRLRQALTNLVANAVKFTEKGTVRIVARLLEAWRDGQAGLRIDVIDTGIGIDPDRLSQLGQPFVQADASTSRKFGGTGLGLVITRKLVDLMAGELGVRSTPGQGSTFTITIPAGPLAGVGMLADPDKAAMISAPAQAAPPADALAGLKILVAEDGAVNQLLIRTLLRKAGADVAVASDGREAIEKASAAAFDVILMDMQMPNVDGYQATAALRTQGCAVPIIALTAHALTGDRDKCLAAGCTDYLTKPIDRAAMILAVARHARGARRGELAAASKMPAPEAQAGAMVSLFASDAELAGILDGFVAGLAARTREMRDALAAAMYPQLQRVAHQLKGAGGSFGYPALSRLAGELELAAKAGDVEVAGPLLARLAEMCEQIAQGHRRGAEAESKRTHS